VSLKNVEIKEEYRSLVDNVAKDFYIPLLKEAVLYKRAVGFFSSSALIHISKGISGLIKNKGKMLVIASPYLSEEDILAIRKGYELRDKIIKNALLRGLKNAENVIEEERLNLLANLISQEVLDIKIAFTENKNRMGLYHEKMGIISDACGNRVAFSGSMNESENAMILNYEAIDVFCSWKGENDRVMAKEDAFNSIWNNLEPSIRAIEFPDLKQEIIDRYKKKIPRYDIDEYEYECTKSIDIVEDSKKSSHGPRIPIDVKLHDYQLEAINEWERHNFKGIFDMATGTGKTYTALGAIVRLSKKLSNCLAVFIVCPYQHLVEQWVEELKTFNINPIIGYSASFQRNWKKLLENSIRDQKLKVKNKNFFCFICTNATFASEFIQNQIGRIKGNALLVIDEAHNFGAKNLSNLLSNKFNFRLALSATLERHNDREGTDKIFEYFGDKCIEYTLERAIQEGKLTRYKYYPVLVTLNEKELETYMDLTSKIGNNLIKDKKGNIVLSELGKMLALARARLVAGAKDKINKLEECIIPYLNDKHILVYCGSANLLKEDEDVTPIDDEDIRQIDVVTDLLGNKLGMRVSQFTSKESIKEREILKREFTKGDNLQALIAIKCLDEGVNIPKIKVAFILASTTNPKEYIQRRGRVLRLAEGKEYAEIYDFITLPRPLDKVHLLTEEIKKKDLSLINRELARAQEFARLSMNMFSAEAVIDEVKNAYCIRDNIIIIEEDYYE